MTATKTRKPTLARFRVAQDRKGAYSRALREIKRGEKQTHWMWFVFPQLRALAKSDVADYFGIADRAEAVAYMHDPTLRLRLYECTVGVLVQDRLMFSDTDTRKLRSCMTLFREVADDPAVPNAVLTKFYEGTPDQLTLDVLAGKPIVLPKPRHVQGSLLDRHWRDLPRTRPAVRLPAPEGPWTRDRVQSFVRSFGLSTVATRQMVDAWMTDRGRAMGAAWAAADTTWDDQG
jgi:uncharacterized protein (DUF1810 family)